MTYGHPTGYGITDDALSDFAGIAPHKIRGFGFCSVFGRTLYVDSNHPHAGISGRHGAFKAPFATIARAMQHCRANQGDVILVAPGHTEEVKTSGGITCNVAGVTVRGVGHGSLMPTITFTTATTAKIVVTAANVTLENLRLVCGKTGADHVTMLSLGDAAAYAVVRNCWFMEGASTRQTIDYITMAHANAADCLIENCRCVSETQGSDSFITTAAAVPGLQIRGCFVRGNFAQAPIDLAPAAVVNCEIIGNHLRQKTATKKTIIMHANATGEISHNLISSQVAAPHATDIITGGNCRMHENYASDTDANTSGVLTPVAT